MQCEKNLFSRSSGILLHPTSLPGRFGIGDLGRSSYQFVDFLYNSGQTLWQILPLGPTGYGNSPYACLSAFAGNPLLISLEELVKDGLLLAKDIETVPTFSESRINFPLVIDFKENLLGRAFENFKNIKDVNLIRKFNLFCHQESFWLKDYAFYRALKDFHGGMAWSSWEKRLARRDPSVCQHAEVELQESIEEHKFYQYIFFKQWIALKQYCNSHNIKIIGDLPIFVAYDSVDVWANPEIFKLTKNGDPIVVSGVPPDYFSATGQLWGNPIYDWEKMRKTKFQWWVNRLTSILNTVDIVRIDHFRGFAACWEIPFGEQTAEKGVWVNVPGRELFTLFKEIYEDLPIIAEDLGLITPDVIALRNEFGFPGMRILQFGFGGDSKNVDLPHNYIPNTIAYTGTHDNDTVVGWFNSNNSGSTRSDQQIIREREFCLKYINSNGKEISWDFIRTVLASVASVAMIPLQDLLGLDSSARMNLPASSGENWNWRFRSEDLTSKLSDRLKNLSELYGRTT